MLSITRKTDYALVALAALDEAGPDQPRSARQIAEAYELPLPSMMNVFKTLQHAGFVRSARGAHGGYYLAERTDRIRLISVIEAIEGPVQLTMCCEDDEDGEPCLTCSLIHRCPVTEAMRKVNEKINTFLSRITIRDLMASDIQVPLENVSLP